MTQIKICGITNLADARYASGAGADFLGFIQHEASPRYIAPDMARDIISWVYGARPVGVFVDRDAEEVNQICKKAGFEFAQLHGDESVEYCQQMDQPIIKVFHVDSQTSADNLKNEYAKFEGIAEYFLVDTGSETSPGGTGKTFDWSILEQLSSPLPLFLAGGLTPENIFEAVTRVGPFGVDVSSGVEESPGKKDFERIDDFVRAIRNEA